MKEAKFTCSGIALGFRLLGGRVVPSGIADWLPPAILWVWGG